MTNKIIEELNKILWDNIDLSDEETPRPVKATLQSDLEKFIEDIIQSVKQETAREIEDKINTYIDNLIKEGAEEQSDYYMGQLNTSNRIKELL